MVVKRSDLEKELSEIDNVLPEVVEAIDETLRERFWTLENGAQVRISIWLIGEVDDLEDKSASFMHVLKERLVEMYSTDEEGNPNWKVKANNDWLEFQKPSDV